jgi:solute carrier family 8 (sodium/calcium exchanger)
MFGPTLFEDDGVESITHADAFWHFLSIPWKLLFACVPPRRYWGGYPAFIISLVMMGLLTFFIIEIVEAGGCLMDMRACVQAFCLISIGTSLPDMFTSVHAARDKTSLEADAAIGSFASANAANVFIGLGLPWTCITVYE